MRIHRSTPAGDFTIIPNETLRDERLSFAARGHLAYLLSRPDDWRTNADAEAERARRLRDKRGEGRVSMRAVYKELKDAGYMVLVKAPGKGGMWTTETHVYNRPFAEFPQVAPTCISPNVGEPTYSSPGVGSPAVGGTDRRLTGTSSTKTEHEDQDQPRSQEQPIAKSQDRRFPDGPGTAAADAQQFPLDNSGSATTGGNVRARKPAA